MTEELKRCPFCNSEATIKTVDCDGFSFWKVTCGNPLCLCCNARLYGTKASAVNDWNKRALYEQMEEENELLYGALDEIVNRNDFSRYCDISQLDDAINDYNIQIDAIPLIRIAQKALKEVKKK